VAVTWLACLVLATVVVSLPGTGAWVSRDDGNHLYAGQRLQDGVLPGTSIFNYVGTVSQLFCGGAIALGRRVAADDVRAVRVGFLAVVVLTVALLVQLGYRLTGSPLGAAGAAVYLLSLSPLVHTAAAGPEKYVLVVCFQAVALDAVLRRRWLACGAACAAAGLTWQGGWLLLPASAAALLAQARPSRVPPLARLSLGAALPVAALIALYAALGSAGDLFDAYVRFNLTHAGLGFASTRGQLMRIGAALGSGGTAWVATLALGLAATVAVVLRPPTPELRALRAVLGVSVAGYLLMAWFDFPSILRLFPLFVPATTGAAGALGSVGRTSRRAAVGVAALLVLGASLAVSRSARTPGTGLAHQQQGVEEMRRRFGPQARIVALGAPEYLVLAHEVSPTPYLLFDRGLDRWIDTTYPGGFRAWGSALLEPPPDVIVVGYLEGDLPRRFHDGLAAAYRPVRIGPWKALVRSFPATPERSP